jgi:hypothetical protein
MAGNVPGPSEEGSRDHLWAKNDRIWRFCTCFSTCSTCYMRGTVQNIGICVSFFCIENLCGAPKSHLFGKINYEVYN